MKNILVTGGAGFIGSHLVDHLLTEGCWRVTVIDNFEDFYRPFIKHKNIKDHIYNPAYTLASGDILCETLLEEVFSATKFDAIVHLAARAGVRPSISNPQRYADTNVRGTLNLLECAKKYKVRKFVFGSSSSVYGNRAAGGGSHRRFSESDPVNQPISPYAATKIAGEMLCHTYAHLYGLICTCLRFFTVYGPRQRPDLAINKFTRLIALEKPIQVFGDGTTKRDYTYIDDIVKGIRAAIGYDRSRFEIFNLGASKTTELRNLIKMIERTLGKKAVIERLPAQPGDVFQTFADIRKARRYLNYDPVTPIEKGIEKFAQEFKIKRSSAGTFTKTARCIA